MSKYITMVITVALLSAPILATGQSGEAETKRQVLATDERRVEALRRNDPAPLRKIYADDYTLVTEDGVVHTKTDQLEALASGLLRYDKFDVTERTVRVYGDVVVLVSREQSTILRAGRQVGGDLRSTRVYKKFGTEWRVIATHASSIAR